MSDAARGGGFEPGQRRLNAHLARLRARLEAAVAGQAVAGDAPGGEEVAGADLSEAFGLSEFERAVLNALNNSRQSGALGFAS